MTAAEISAKLVDYGSIKKPLALNKLGTVLRKAGYTPRKAHGGRHGFVVYIRQDIDNQRKIEARDAVEEIENGVHGVDGVDVF